jgi:YidC/Oxa1 family membrane protein insertase
MQNQGFDSKLLLTIALTMAVFLGYQYYLAQKYPNLNKQKIATESKENDTALAKVPVSTSDKKDDIAEANKKNSNKKDDNKLTPEQEIVWSNEHVRITVSSYGMSFKSVVLLKHTDREGKPIEFLPVNGTLNYETNLIGRTEPLVFTLEKTSANQLVGKANYSGMRVLKTINIDPNNSTIDTTVRVENLADHFIGISTRLSQPILPPKSSGLLPLPSFEHQEIYLANDDDFERTVLGSDESIKKLFSKARVVGLTTQYFVMGLHDLSDIIPDAEWRFVSNPDKSGSAIVILNHTVLNRSNDFNVRYLAYVGPKGYNQLKAIDSDMTGFVNFGFFNMLAVWIYKLLQAIYKFVGNWGFSIIILTAIVRLLVLPFNIMSYKSMRIMAKVQPQVKAIQEKYKNDRQKANEEVMRLMRDNKANPIGGCLPMFLQIPIFFALYQVLGQSVELYKAPFIFWIKDLSFPDPYYLIPLLMTGTMYLQQKITPSTMEPAQQKIMLFMLMGFSIFFFSLPSGLTLYMFVSTLFGVVQQVYFLKTTNEATK